MLLSLHSYADETTFLSANATAVHVKSAFITACNYGRQTTSKHPGNLMMSGGGMAAETFARLGESDNFRQGVERREEVLHPAKKAHPTGVAMDRAIIILPKASG